MKKEMLKGFTMVVLTVAVTLAAAVVSANAQSGRAQAVIPFDFTVANQSMAAGAYTLASITQDSQGLVIRNDDTGKSVIRLCSSLSPKANETQARLVFHKYGQRYFLAEVWAGGESSGLKVPESREERAIRRESERLAQKSYETVELLAKNR